VSANPEAYLALVERERDEAFDLLRRVKATGKLSDMLDDALLDDIDALVGEDQPEVPHG
jgi:hypothetical protein